MIARHLTTSLAVLVFTSGLAFAQDAANGEKLFKQRCGACHATDAAAKKMGPHLDGVVGRAAGSVEGAKYSDALKASGLTWDETLLDAFLTNPKKAVPGTTMAVALPNAAQRADIIAYLKSLN